MFLQPTEARLSSHIILVEHVAADPTKVQFMVRWPILKNIRWLRKFLGLTRYYMKFVKGYGKNVEPLIILF